jgi:PIN domain nuclease of toxin-antitoxin system
MSTGVAPIPAGDLLVDASFLVGVVNREPLALRFADLISRSIVTAVNLGETLYKVEEISGIPGRRTEDVLVGLGLRVRPIDLAVARRFPELKAFDAKSRGRRGRSGVAKGAALSLADVCALAYAWEYELPALTGDGRWAEVARVGLPVVVVNYRDPKLRG